MNLVNGGMIRPVPSLQTHNYEFHDWINVAQVYSKQMVQLWPLTHFQIMFFSSFSTLTIGLQSMTDELMYTIPLRDTVAGEALSMLCGSNTTLHCGDIGMRSPLAKVSVLLSSNTLFRFSIHMASTGPSRTIQMCSPTTRDNGKYKQ